MRGTQSSKAIPNMASTGTTPSIALRAFFAIATVGAGLTGVGYLIKPDVALAFNGLPADTNAATCYVSFQMATLSMISLQCADDTRRALQSRSSFSH